MRSLSSVMIELGLSAIGDATEDLVFLEMFAAPEFQEVSLNNWLRSLPVQVAAAHTGLSAEEITSIPMKAEHLLG